MSRSYKKQSPVPQANFLISALGKYSFGLTANYAGAHCPYVLNDSAVSQQSPKLVWPEIRVTFVGARISDNKSSYRFA